MAEEDLNQQIRERFPDIAHIVDLFPEIRELVMAALNSEDTDHEWTDEEFNARLRETNWWRSRSESMRTWDVESLRDPGQAARRRDLRRQTIEMRAELYGVSITEYQLNALANDSLRFGYTDEEITSSILGFGTPGQFGTGTIAASADEIQQIARSYLTTLSNADAQSWALRIERGEASIDTLRTQFSLQAQQAFPQLSDQLKDGSSVYDATANIRGYVAQTLGLGSADDIDLNDARWADLIDYDPGDGKRRMMTRGEAGRYARNQLEYGQTEEARSLASNIVSMIGETFGKRAS